MTDCPEFVARNLVRTFSNTLNNNEKEESSKSPSQKKLEEALREEVQQQDSLAALLQEAISDQNRDAAQKLRARYEELEIAFRDFRNAFPELMKEKESVKAISWSSLRQTVTRLQTQHDAKAKKGVTGQSKSHFHRICEKIDNHSHFLKILPQGDKYTSLVCGSLEVIVKASVNHERIGQDFSKALEEIDEIVSDVRQELALYQAPHLKDQSIRLCCKILAFLTFPLEWYSQKKRKRLMSSFNENLSSAYETHIQEIRRISQHIQRGVYFCGFRELREVHSSLDKIRYLTDSRELYQRENWRMDEKDWEIFHTAKEEHDRGMRNNGQQFLAFMSQQFGDMFGGNIGKPVKQILDREAEKFVTNRREIPPSDDNPARIVSAAQVLQDTQEYKTGPGIEGAETREDVERASEVLNPFLDFDRFLVEGSEVNNFVEAEAVQRLQLWTELNRPAILGVFGPASLSENSSTRLLTSNYVQAAKLSGMPCISYFCAIANETPPPGRLRETMGLVSLLYGMIKQLILYLPLRMVSSASVLDIQQFGRLDGTLRTWEAALTLFDNLLDHVEPPFMLIAIHGLEMIEHEATNKYLGTLLQKLKDRTQGRKSDEPNDTIFKVLLTTCGISHVLANHLEEDDILDLNRGGAAENPGHARKGRIGMNHLSYLQ